MSISQNFPSSRPSLSLNFARSQTLDPRITFTRTTSGTRVGPDGYIEVIPADQPRFDFDPMTGECLGLMIEEQRTNLITSSNNFGTGTSEYGITSGISSPDGTLNAVLMYEGTNNGYHFLTANANVTNTITYCGSIFCKYAGTNYRFRLKLGDALGVQSNIIIDLRDGSIISGNGVDNLYGVIFYPNGWFRVYTTITVTQTGVLALQPFLLRNSDGASIYQGDGSSGFYIYGMQIEQGSFPTSYIPTSGSTVTRTVDNAKIDGIAFSSFYNPSEGTVYTQFRCDNWNVSNSFGKVFTINEGIFGVENNGFWIGNDANTSNSVRYRVRASGINQFGPANLIRTSNVVKSAIAVKTSDFAVTIDGNTPTASTSGTLSTSMTNMTIGRDIVGIDNAFLNGTISQLTYYPVRLHNNVLQSLTK